jgi:hypothetical protein
MLAVFTEAWKRNSVKRKYVKMEVEVICGELWKGK